MKRSANMWSTLWHARLKSLAATLRPEFAQQAKGAWSVSRKSMAASVPAATDAAVTWMGRTRIRVIAVHVPL